MRMLARRSVERRGVKVGKGKKAVEKWEPDFHKLLVCDNGHSNIPEVFNLHNTSFMISQSTSAHKPTGQDAMGTASNGNWIVDVLCDGHDLSGHNVARAVCDSLPRIVMEKTSRLEDPDGKIEKQLLVDAFSECANEILWTSDDVRVGMFVRVFGGEWEGKVGYLHDSNRDYASLVVVDEEGYHRPQVMMKHLKRSKYTGGCTCLCILRNQTNGNCIIATAGDSRALLFGAKAFEDEVIRPVFGLVPNEDGAMPPMGLSTPAHNVFNKDELLRLNQEHEGAFELDGAFLVNPITKFAIQPTRGFGDFDMYGTGYLNEPEVSSCFRLRPGTLVFAASDGVFDGHVWKDDELVSFFHQHASSYGENMNDLAKLIYDETLHRSLQGGYVDDISLFLYRVPDYTAADFVVSDGSDSASEVSNPSQSEKRNSLGEAGNRKSILRSLWSKKKNCSKNIDESKIKAKPVVEAPSKEDRRKTIDRKDRGSFSEFLKNALKEADNEQDQPPEENKELANVVLQRFANRYGHSTDDIDIGREAANQAAKTGARMSQRISEEELAKLEEEKKKNKQ